MYSIVVFNALLLGLLGLSALAVARIERRQGIAGTDQQIARENAASAVAAALARIKADAGWRSTFSHNTESASIAFTSGSATWRLVDMVNSSLSNDPRDGVLIQGIGRCGTTIWIESVEALQPERPLPSLVNAIHCDGRLRIDSGGALTVIGGLASTDDEFRVDGSLFGSAQCGSRDGSGGVSRTVTTGIDALEAPTSSTLFATYKNLASSISFHGGLANDLLGPGVNTYGGGTDSDGIYYIDTGGSTLVIEGTRLLGTLVVKGNVTINDKVLLQFHRHDAPVLLVDGSVVLQCDSTRFLTEALLVRNFNPASAPFQGASDIDSTDIYPSEIWGFVHVTGDLDINAASRVVGMVLVDGETRIVGSPTIQADPTIFFAPPTGYWTAAPGPLRLKPGQWRRAALP